MYILDVPFGKFLINIKIIYFFSQTSKSGCAFVEIKHKLLHNSENNAVVGGLFFKNLCSFQQT